MPSSIGSSIAGLLGTGSGIDTAALVSQLVSATRTPREAAISSRASENSARISALASATSSLETFSTALTETLKSASYAGQPASTDPTVVSVTALPGGTPTGLPAQIKVTQLALAQSLDSVNLASATTAVGLGTLTLTVGSNTAQIDITAANNSLDGLAAAINETGLGVTAQVVTDVSGSRLLLRGQTGAANAFTLRKLGGDTADTDLQRFTWNGGSGNMTRRQTAVDSIIKLDNATIQSASNTLENVIPYVRIDLNKVSATVPVTIATDEPTTSVKDLVKEFVTAYNTLRSALNSATVSGADASTAGALAGDPGVRDMVQQLARLTTTTLASTGDYKTLNDIGISTNRNGTLALNETRLDAAIAADAGAVARMINPAVSTASDPGLAAAVKAVKDNLQSTNGSLATSKAKYDKLATELSKQLEKLDTEMTDYEARLTATYAAMEKRLNAFKATQTYLEQQIAQWNNSDS